MPYRPRYSALAAMAVLLFSGGLLSQTAGPQKKATASEPDFSGVWRRSRRPPDKTRQYTLGELTGSIGEVPPMTPWGEAKFKTTKPNTGPRAVALADTNDPIYKCYPPGVPRIYTSRLGGPFEIIQTPGRVTMIYEYDHFVRQFFTDGRPHAEDLSPTWMGDSVGKWEGNTLVVDTVGFNDKTWLDNQGHPHSDAMHLVERIRRVSHDSMTDDITFDDPKAYTKPWVAHMIFELKPDWKLVEYVCEDFINFEGLQKTSETPK